MANEDAMRWEEGCQLDDVRNQFVIPRLVYQLERARSPTILDVGAGTGYVPRIVDSRLSYQPSWTLIDTNPNRLAVASQKCPSNLRFHALEANVLHHSFAAPFAAVLATFTLLEIEDTDRLIGIFPGLIEPSGILLVTLPDAWHDVLGSRVNRDGRIAEFLMGRTSVPKIDKFTSADYPFRAVRIEHLISQILSSGFELFELAEAGDAQGNVYLLAFRRLPVR